MRRGSVRSRRSRTSSVPPAALDRAAYVVSERGIELPAWPGAKYLLVFDDYPLMTLRPEHRPGALRAFEPWPGDLRQYLDGVAHLEVRVGEESVDLGEVSFGSSTERLRFVDSFGIPIVIDKWGLAQRPFANRTPEVAAYMARFVERMMEAVRRDTGIELWLAFGTLLGAARTGKVIPHDSDVDLAYYSQADTPAAMAIEMFRIKRALADDGAIGVEKVAEAIAKYGIDVNKINPLYA